MTTSSEGISLAHCAVGDGDRVFLHANGFCKEVWEPVVDELTGAGYLLVDQWGHGESPAPPTPFDWWDLARDLIRLLDALGSAGLEGVGHSLGGAVLAMADILQPGLFRRLVLVEPILVPPPYERTEDHPLVRGAERRRLSFPSLEEAAAAYRGRGPFVDWREEALQAYVTHGFREEGGAWMLRCLPEVEAEFYRSHSEHAAWERLGEIRCPVVLVVGGRSDSAPAAVADRLSARFAEGVLRTVPGGSHFLPMEQPSILADIIREG